MKLYHVTNKKNINGIKKSGLVPLENIVDSEAEAIEIFIARWPDSGVELATYHITCIHLHKTLQEALEYVELCGPDDWVILEVEIDQDDPDYDIDNLEYPHPIYYGVISPDKIKILQES